MTAATAPRVLMRDDTAEHQIRLNYATGGQIAASCNCGVTLAEPRTLLPADEALAIYRKHLEDAGVLTPQENTPGQGPAGSAQRAATTVRSRAMTNPNGSGNRATFIAGLRDLADLLERIPEVPVYEHNSIAFALSLEDFAAIEAAAQALTARGVTFSRHAHDGTERLEFNVGGIRYGFSTMTAEYWTRHQATRSYERNVQYEPAPAEDGSTSDA